MYREFFLQKLVPATLPQTLKLFTSRDQIPRLLRVFFTRSIKQRLFGLLLLNDPIITDT